MSRQLFDCYVYGHVIQETSIPPVTPDEVAEQTTTDQLDEYLNLVVMYEHARKLGHSLDGEFAFGLDLILDGLERDRSA
ncbi:MAG TPA: TetR/AcrR family transcriptional regulator C-terminal domain-containing protein [Acidimicrobiia bacterium]|nr:TetR/AcrR family transcriptional regulator C-terminal domain-containing protein [Acidimicrobiia bacterium]